MFWSKSLFNIDIIFLGAGGGNYEASTQNYVKKILNKIKPLAIISRDSDAYKLYSEFAKFSYDGIDCGFFINDWYNPPKINDSYVAVSFDKIDEPRLDISKKIIRLHHKQFYNKEEFFQQPNTIISDDPKDYLTIYSNAIETHTDRVHACVASLAYGIPARLYFNSPRAKLLDKVIDKDITKELVKVDSNMINKKKIEQINILKEVIK